MNTFNWTKAFGFGVLLWLIMFALVSFLVGINQYEVSGMKLVIAAVAGILAYLFATNIWSLSSWQEALGYGAVWVAVGIVLDFLISKQFNAVIFNSWQYWLGYALILLVPMLRTKHEDVKSVDFSR